MRRMRRIAQKHITIMHPAPAPQAGKLPPVRLVDEQRRALQHVAEQVSAKRGAFLFAHRVEAQGAVSLGAAFDDKGAAVGRKPIVMRVEPAFACLDECLGQRVKGAFGSEPGKAIPERLDRGPEGIRKAFPHHRIQPVSADHQIGVERGRILDAMPEHHVDAQTLGALAQQVVQLASANGGKPDTVQRDGRAGVVEHHVAPALHMRRDQVVGLGVVCAQEIQRLI